MNATLILHSKVIAHGLTVERKVWQLPQPLAGSQHSLKYRLYCGKQDGTCVVRYDNEAGKGDHKHIGDAELSYPFTTLTALLTDFQADIDRLTGT